MPVTPMRFEDAIADANRRCDELSVLLGNGFSIAYDPSIFSYDSLAEEAELASLSRPKAELFETLQSSNFETIVEKLRAAAALTRMYGGDEDLAATFIDDANVVRNGLADVLASRHPDNASTVSDSEATHARLFLQHFRTIYTLSYDLLLYWVVNRNVGPHVQQRDGFEWPSWNDSSRTIWKSKPTQGRQRVFFLHGALHLFVRDRRVEKLTYNHHGSLVSELRSRLESGIYPLVVTEGTRAEKEARIERSGFLRFGLRRFSRAEGALFIHGMSLSPNDDHVLELIEADGSAITALYVGVHGAVDSPTNRTLIARAKEIKENRRSTGGRRLRLRFYDAGSVELWRPN